MNMILAALTLSLTATAQVVKLANHSGVPWEGWVRTTIDAIPTVQRGRVGDSIYVVGSAAGLNLWKVDVKCRLEVGGRLSLDLATALPYPFVLAPLPQNPLEHFGGPATLAGQQMSIESLRIDGAAYTVELHARVGRMLSVRHWATWYPDQPGWAHGETVVCASNPAVPEIMVLAPADLTLRFGDALGLMPGKGMGPLVPAGTKFIDGQARGIPSTWVWLRHLQSPSSWSSVGAAVNWSIGATGIAKLLPFGNPQYPPGYDGMQWARSLLPEAIRRIHTWEPGVCGPNPGSTITGAQEDQTFVRGEALLQNGTGAELVAYLSALRLMSRPNHYLEVDGRQIGPSAHPNCVLWAGRPHFNHSVSPDRLGKTSDVNGTETPEGWFGADREHNLQCTTMAGYRYTGSPALAWELEMQARQLLMSETLPSMKPGWATNGADAARSVGWLGIMAVHLWHNLANRALAEQIKERYRQKVLQIYVPQLGSNVGNIWDVRLDDPRIGPGYWWILWQQSIGVYGLDLAGEVLGIPQARDIARRGALACVEHGWIRQDPVTLRTLAADGSPLLTAPWRDVPGIRWTHAGKPTTAPYVGIPLSAYDGQDLGVRWYITTWNVPAIATVLRHDPTHAKALSILAQIRATLGPTDRRSWFPPELQLP
jgi:hypothetical protein